MVTFLELSMMQTARRAHVPEVHRPHPDRPGDSHILPFQVSKIKQSASLFITLCGPSLPLLLRMCSLLFSLHCDECFTSSAQMPGSLCLLTKRVGIFSLESGTSSGVVGSWTVNWYVPFPGKTNSWFGFCRTVCRTEMSKKNYENKAKWQAAVIYISIPWCPLVSSLCQ